MGISVFAEAITAEKRRAMHELASGYPYSRCVLLAKPSKFKVNGKDLHGPTTKSSAIW